MTYPTTELGVVEITFSTGSLIKTDFKFVQVVVIDFQVLTGFGVTYIERGCLKCVSFGCQSEAK